MMASRGGREICIRDSLHRRWDPLQRQRKTLFYLELEQRDEQCVSPAVLSAPPVERAHYRLVIHIDEHLGSPSHVRLSGSKLM